MELVFTLLVLLLIGVWVVLPIWTLVAISNLRRDQRELNRRLAALEAGGSRPGAVVVPAATASPTPQPPVVVSSPTPTVAPSRPPLEGVAPPPLPPGAPSLTASTAAAAVTSTPVSAAQLPGSGAEQSTPAAPSGLGEASSTGPAETSAKPAIPVAPSAPVRPAPKPAPPPAPRINWEVFMGVKLFAWIGGLALFLGVGFFVKYSFEHDLIPPEVRVALGFLTGAALVVGGVLLSPKRYTVTSHTLCATGVVSLYAVTFACHAVYKFEFFGALPTFGLMALITGAAFLLAIRMEAKVVAILGLLGGFLTPVLLSTGQDNPVGLFSYLALLNVGLIAVALHRRWHFLLPLGAAGTVVMQLGWAAKFFAPGKEHTAEIVVLGFSVLYVLAFLAGRRLRQASSALMLTAATVPFVAFVFAWSFLGHSEITGQPGAFFSFLLVADALVFAVAWFDPRASRLHALAGVAAFVVLAAWTSRFLGPNQLYPALAAYLGFAALHAIAPLLLVRRHGSDLAPAGWQQLWPAFMLLLVLLGVGRLPDVPTVLWVAVLLLDALAIGVAVVCASVLGVIAVLVLTLASAGHWLLRMPTEDTHLLGFLLVVGGFALLFVGAGIWLMRHLQMGQEPGAARGAADSVAARLQAQLPTLAVLLPFLLLMMAVARLKPADPSAVFGLGFALTVLALGVTQLLRFGWLPLATLAGVTGMLFAWHQAAFVPGLGLAAVAWYVGFHVVFAVFPFVFRQRLADLAGPWIAAALSGVAVFPLVLRAVKLTWPNEFMGAVPVAFAIPGFLSLAVVLRWLPVGHPRRLSTLAWFGGVALFFVTLVFPIQFSRQWITLGWALEGVALLWWFHRVPHPGLRLTGLGLLVAGFVRLALNPDSLAAWTRSGPPFLNWVLYTFLTVALCQFAGARLLAPPRDRLGRFSLPGLLQALGVVLLFILMNLQVADFFTEPGEYVRLRFSGNFARDMTTTISWSVFALALLVVGLALKKRPARWAALALLSVALLKLFFHDLSQLGQLYRIGAFIAVAVIAILASFIYQRFLPAAVPADDAAPPAPPSA